ncbi:hypothetical protein CONLIGDRAFT_295656 [Coniochaeta ligniaria NRRL 30616]|uniref:AMP-dependent synthetase/ligase domain-containing protein n=1 Tax=Coniochaeta ligniaria NRRL 30616 TaxID=1408157 RepID=A0A1J7JCE1_9PEZI|nr:hypothetical protein CONLIGDRAFT_295656 [Coniochaeta ligniaria NRRL 30616]
MVMRRLGARYALMRRCLNVQRGGRIGSIGVPFRTVMAFILAPDGQKLIPYGAVGELCIGGPQAAAGYVDRDDLTNAASVPNDEARTATLPHRRSRSLAAREARLSVYRGKIARSKVHGHRIELGEVESAIRKTGLIKDVLALVSKLDNNPRLAATRALTQANDILRTAWLQKSLQANGSGCVLPQRQPGHSPSPPAATK